MKKVKLSIIPITARLNTQNLSKNKFLAVCKPAAHKKTSRLKKDKNRTNIIKEKLTTKNFNNQKFPAKLPASKYHGRCLYL